MDTDLHCNILKCRKPLSDKAVVTTCSHIFCVECAQEKFRAAQLCPACETTLTEPDDVVICSLQPTNDYRTSVLSGLSPTLVLDICSRALSFWQYQVHQESAFQQALLKNINERNAQLSKQLENVIREANSELTLLSTKVSGLERELELEQRRTKDLSEALKEKDKEYQKLKTQYDRIKRKALLNPAQSKNAVNLSNNMENSLPEMHEVEISNRMQGIGLNTAAGLGVSMGDVVNDMEANRIQRTPVRPVAGGGFANPQAQIGGQWQQQPQLALRPSHTSASTATQRRARPPQHPNTINNRSIIDRYDRNNGSDSEEIEELLRDGQITNHRQYRSSNGSFLAGSGNMVNTGLSTSIRRPAGNQQGMSFPPQGTSPRLLDIPLVGQNNHQVIAAPTVRRSGTGFRPASFAIR